MADEQQADARALLLETLYEDEETRPALQALIAKKHPKAVSKMPDFVARESISREREEWRKERDEDKKSREQERNARELDSRRSTLVTGFTGRDGSHIRVSLEEIPEIEKLMLSEGIASHQAAAELYAAQRRVAAPSPVAYSRNAQIPGVNGAGGADFDWLKPGIAGDRTALDRVARDEAERVWSDLRSGRGDKWIQNYGG